MRRRGRLGCNHARVDYRFAFPAESVSIDIHDDNWIGYNVLDSPMRDE
jgi:hypothetical protein